LMICIFRTIIVQNRMGVKGRGDGDGFPPPVARCAGDIPLRAGGGERHTADGNGKTGR